MIPPYDVNEVVFPLVKTVLVENPNATRAENRFTETNVKVDPKTLEQCSNKDVFHTLLDEERVASGLNHWNMFDIDVIKNDVCTSKQEATAVSRSSRGPMPAELVRRRVSHLAEYFSKHKFVQRSIVAPPADVFFTDRVSILTPSGRAALVKKHRDLEAAHFESLVKEGERLTTWCSEKEYKFKSPEAKTLMDEKMGIRAR